MTIEELSKGLQSGKRRFLAKAITLVESSRVEDQKKSAELISALPKNPDSLRVGISGVPGVGKSTFIEALGNHLINQGHRVAVLAVDPSSPTSGGSILGDKTRMETLSSKEEAFIRPSPTAGTLGGVAKRTRESIRLCEAAGYDIILVETVGVGQSEFEVASMVDCFLVLMMPGTGDSLQGIKRGILEITDILVVNKADGDLQKLAEMAKSEFQHAFHMLIPKYQDIEVSILTMSALHNKGIVDVWDAITKFKNKLRSKKIFDANRQSQDLEWFKRQVEDEIIRNIWKNEHHSSKISELKTLLEVGKLSPSDAAQQLITFIKK